MQIIRTMPLRVDRYVELNFHRRVPRPAQCPHCGVGHTLQALGYYWRNLTNPNGTVLSVSIRRFRCRDCRKTVSILPSFAQPYKLVLTATINAFFCGHPGSEALSWRPHLRRYWNRFTNWIPDLHRFVGSLLARCPPVGNPGEWWTVLVAAFGDLETMTKKIIEQFRITVFRRYRCHSPFSR